MNNKYRNKLRQQPNETKKVKIKIYNGELIQKKMIKNKQPEPYKKPAKVSINLIIGEEIMACKNKKNVGIHELQELQFKCLDK